MNSSQFFSFLPSGSFTRIGDYYTGDQNQTPFTIFAEGVGKFQVPAISGTGSRRLLRFRDENGKLEITITLTFDAATRIMSRRDTLRNLTKEPIMLRTYLARFPFNHGEYEVYGQRSIWAAESVGNWNRLHNGAIVFNSREGRWAESSTPFAVLRDSYSSHALAFFVMAMGDWQIRFAADASTGAGKLTEMNVEAGLNDAGLQLELAPKENWDAPEILIQVLPGREAWSGTAACHEYLNRRFPPRPGHAPVVYNTWLDRMDELSVPRLERQLAAARNCGCEVFVVDYGWYDDQRKFCRYNDWTELTDRSFKGKMADFADRVRKAGLGFGFWVEFEFFYNQSEMVKKHPDWFFESAHPNIVVPKTWIPEVEDYLVESLAATIRRYKAVYVKNDMNHSQGYEPGRLNRYAAGLLRIMTRLRQMLPEVTFENCSSGGARASAGVMCEAFDYDFISDNGAPLDNIRMFQGLMMRCQPSRVYHWYVASELPCVNEPSYEPGLVIQPQEATWFRFETVDFNFGLLANLTGPIGLSCDLASFSPEKQAAIARYTAFYKENRERFLRTVGTLLTPPECFDKRRGWIAYELADPVDDYHFVYVFHSRCDGDGTRRFHLAGLQPNRKYRLVTAFPENDATNSGCFSGRELLEDGLEVVFNYRDIDQHLSFGGFLLVLKPEK